VQAFNPPLAHSIDVACPPWAPRRLGRLMAVARGDGHIAVYDADHVERAPKTGKKSKVELGRSHLDQESTCQYYSNFEPCSRGFFQCSAGLMLKFCNLGCMFARAVSHYEVRQEAKMTLKPKLF
jgi:hypothetical protein